MLVDSHCHIEMSDFAGDRTQVLQRAGAAGVGRILCIGSGDWKAQSMRLAAEVAEQHSEVDTTVGLHPHDAEFYGAAVEAELLARVKHPKVVGWGEVGLDYHYLHSERSAQLRAFSRQMELAYQHSLPVIIHSRSAEADTVRVLREASRLPLAGVMHCFGGSWEMAQECLDLGFFISFAGNVTFRKATALQEVARRVPVERLLIETDAPFLSPVPVRGTRNEPAHVKHVAHFLADLRGQECQDLEETTARNYLRLFRQI